MQNCGDTQKLFAKSVPVTLKDGFTNQCRKSILFLTVEWKEASAALNKQELLISLTDSNDPFFLYHLHLSEEDFQVLKSSQGLLVDFTAFPQKFIDLIEISVAEEDKASPKFLLIFNTSERGGSISPTSQLDVVETNPFKHLIHLTLKFIAATDSSVKQYLAVTLKKLKEEKQHLESQLLHLEQDSRSRLSSSHASLEQKTQELEKLKNDLSVQLTLRETKHARELQEERDRLLNKQRELEIRYENEKKEKEHNYHKELQQLEKRVSCLDKLNKELEDQNHKRDTTIQELKSCLSSLKDEMRHSKQAVQEHKEKIQELQSELKQKLSEISLQKERIGELDSNNAYLKSILGKLQEQYENNYCHEKALESQLENLQKDYKESKKFIKSQETDINKGREIISKLQREVQVSHEEVKNVQSHMAELQQIISKKDKTIRTLQKELKDSKQNLEEKNYEIKRMSDSYTSLQEHNESLEQQIKSKYDVIKYLNRELVEKGIVPQYVPSTNQEHDSPINKRQSAGDADIIGLVRNASLGANENPKTFSGRRKPQGNKVSPTVAFGKSYRA
ncbi:hypothetical protein JTE90_009956 [Oedothorax gibbosus]|uniref:Spindle assembly abnormal protein 6 homolog n=1 Tax=Oedothorax gibbosus TaxID=931172 RepID=A0AAV6V8J3_9ARAC|nr:hypothetical protein JTE90_009956 [Oedothorax gibbosus]